MSFKSCIQLVGHILPICFITSCLQESGASNRRPARWWGSSEVGRGHSNNINDTVEAEADQFGLILPRWVDDKPHAAHFSSIRKATHRPFQSLSWSVETRSSAICDTQRDPDAKSFLSYLILGDTLVVPQVSACCKTFGSWLSGDESHSFILDSQYRRWSLSKQGMPRTHYRKKKCPTTSCSWAEPTGASEKNMCCCVWCASLCVLNCTEHGLTRHHLLNKLTVSS